MARLSDSDILPMVSCRYGAPMGRPSDEDFDGLFPVHIRRVKLDSGGYDRGGAYWGLGEPLYVAWRLTPDDGLKRRFLRAKDRVDAVKQVMGE